MPTGNILISSLRDWPVYSRFLELDDSLWSPESLRELVVKSEVNPYTLPDDHLACSLRLTKRAVHKYI
jgi:hypothetical protein